MVVRCCVTCFGGHSIILPFAPFDYLGNTTGGTTSTSSPEIASTTLNAALSNGSQNKDYAPGYASGGSTPVDSRSLDGSSHGRDRANSTNNVKVISHSNSVLGLDSMIEARREEGELKRNMVHIEVPFGKPIEEVYDGVHNGPVLGSGISGLVRLVSHKATGIKYAVKCLDLGLVDSPEGLQQLREEIFIMCQLDHPNIVRLEEVYESHSEIYLVQELCLGGELFDRLDEQPDYHYTEGECARLVKQMLCAVRYLHSKGIIHRDLKLENFLFSSTSPDSELKMIGKWSC
jgi:Protein kinase domain